MEWRIYGRQDSHDYGVYSGETAREAIVAMLADAGYDGPVEWEKWVAEPQYAATLEKRDGEIGGAEDEALSGQRVVRLTALARAAGILPSQVAMWARMGLVRGAFQRHEGRGWWYIRLEDAVVQLARWWGISNPNHRVLETLERRIERA